MRVGSAEPMTYLTGRSRKVMGQNMSGYVPWSVGPWSFVHFPQDVVLSVFFPVIVGSILWCAREK